MEKFLQSIIDDLGYENNKLFISILKDIVKNSENYAGNSNQEKMLAYCYDINKNGPGSFVENLINNEDIISFYNNYENDIKNTIENIIYNDICKNITDFGWYDNLDPFFRSFESKKNLVYCAYQFLVWEITVYIENNY